MTAACGASEMARVTRHEVEISGFRYEPAWLSVSPGDTIVWLNRDAVPHTVTSEVGGWDTGPIEAGGSWEWVVEGAGGDYLCVFHPTMTGEVVVASAGD